MSSRHPLSRDPDGNNLHFWGGIILLVVLILTIRFGKSPTPTAPTLTVGVPAGPVQVPIAPAPLVAPPGVAVQAVPEKPPVVTPVQMNQVGTPNQPIPAFWTFSMPAPPVNALLQDPSGTLWVATEQGLGKISGDRFVLLNRSNGSFPADNATCLAHDGQTLWIGTFDGLFRTSDGRNYQKFSSPIHLNSDMVWSLFWDGMTIWAGTQNGFSFLGSDGQFNKVDKQVTNGGLADLWIGAMQRTGKWFVCGNDDGVSIWDTSVIAANPAGWNTLDMFATNLAHNWILSLAVDQGKIWAGTPAGLCRLETPLERVFAGDRAVWENFDRSRGLPSDRVDAVLSFGGDLWGGTPEGLFRIRNGSVRRLTMAEGLLATDVRALAAASETLWIGTSGGVQGLSTRLFQ